MNLNKNNVTPLQITPIPSPYVFFKDNKLDVSDPIIDNSLNYTHQGTYTVTCSSFANNKTKPYHAFNNISDNYWQCDYQANPDFGKTSPAPTYAASYTQNPYTNSVTGNSAYQGGGPSTTKWKTVVGKQSDTPLLGEWIQIQIPTEIPAYLYSYSILTPIPVGNVLTFPTKFIILGSETGDSWEYVDQQNLQTPYDTSNEMPKVFNLNSTNSYHYYRLIITEMPPNNGIVRISHFGLNIMPTLTINRDAFTNMSEFRQLQYFNLKDSHRQFVDYKISQPLSDSKIENYMLENGVYNEKVNNNYDTHIILPGILVSILAISIIVYSTKGK